MARRPRQVPASPGLPPASAPPSIKPTVRVAAGSSKSFATNDSYQNVAASLGIQTSNLSSGAAYSLNPISRNHTLLEFAYRGSWLVKVIVDAVAEDMTRERVNVESDMPPDQIDKLESYMESMSVWQRLTDTIKWSRLYGGCLAVILIEGQRPETPLRIDTVGKDMFKGLLVLDRWMVWPHLDDPVTDLGQNYGMPKYYEVVSDARTIPHMKVHYTRCIRMDGVELPYWQKIAENYWGLSVIEPLFDRLVAFDSATQGAAQLVYRAHLRTLKIKQLREALAYGGDAYKGMIEMVKQLRLFQANEGITLLDLDDEFETHSYNFGGLPDTLIQFGQQLSGAAQIPLVRLFGQSPAGLNATGESDIRNYYDFINSAQEDRLRRPVKMLYDLSHRSLTGEPLPEGFNFDFAPLWQLSDTEKAQIAGTVSQAVVNVQGAGILSNGAALKELRQSSKVTGIFSNITDEEIADAAMAPPMPTELGGESGEESHGQKNMGLPPLRPEQSAKAHGAPNVEDLGLIPGHKSGLDTVEDVDDRYAHLRPISSLRDVQRRYAVTDQGQGPMIEVHGIPIVIETPKGERRQGNGWSAQMASDYGYIQGTNSPEGAHEQLDCFVGEDRESQAIWALEQMDPESGEFDEFKFFIGFPDRQTAIDAYKASHDDAAAKRIGRVHRMNVAAFRSFIEKWNAGEPPPRSNGSAEGMVA